MRLLSMLMPQERRFFALFNQHASLVVEGAADARRDARRTTPTTAGATSTSRKIQPDRARRRRRSRTRPSQLMHNTFVTPFDRDQINKLIQRMDDILDLIQDTAESLTLYDVHTLTAEVRHLANLMQLSCEKVHDAVTHALLDGQRPRDPQDLPGDRRARVRRRPRHALRDLPPVPRGAGRAPAHQAQGGLRAASS